MTVHLDRQVEGPAGSFADGETTWTLPYSVPAGCQLKGVLMDETEEGEVLYRDSFDGAAGLLIQERDPTNSPAPFVWQTGENWVELDGQGGAGGPTSMRGVLSVATHILEEPLPLRAYAEMEFRINEEHPDNIVWLTLGRGETFRHPTVEWEADEWSLDSGDNTGAEPVQTLPMALEVGVTYTLRLVREANAVRAYLNGDLLMERTGIEVLLPFSEAAGVGVDFTHMTLLDYSIGIPGSGAAGGPRGSLVEGLDWTDNEVTAPGDYTSREVVFGIQYPFLYRYSPIHFRRSQHTGQIAPETSGRLQLRHADLMHGECDGFTVLVQPHADKEYVYPVVRALEPGKRKFPIQADAAKAQVTIYDDTPGSVRIEGLDWEGYYHNRARRM